VGSISVSNLDSSRALKTNATKGLESSNLNISDVTNLSTELQIKDNLTFNENDTQTNPIAGQIKLYAKTDGTLYTRDDLGNETAVGGGGVSLQAGYNNNPQIQTTAAIGPLELKESEGVASNTQLEIKNNVDAVVASINGLGAITGSSVNTDNINAQTGTVNITNNVNLQSNQIQGIASETFINNDTHANPAVNNSKLYFKTDDNLYRRNAAGGEFRLSNISLQDAFNNGSQITTDTNSLNLQSTAINPSFPLLTTIDNALNVTAEIRANGDIFCSSLLTPGQILQTGTTDTFNMTSVNTTQRDAIAGPTLGALVFNNQTETVDLYKSTGGTSNVTFDVLVVGGGGAGGVAVGGLRAAGGGGAGGYIYQQGEVRQSGTYNISVGAGAPVPATQTIASQGGNSQFDNLTAIGGGGGAGTCQIVNPIPNDFPSSSGGSGGGGSDSTCWQGSAGTPGQGNNGGNNTLEGFSPNGTAGSGGGGAGGVGQNITANNVENGGAGGAGVSNTITGVSYTYSAGGRGGNKSSNNNGTAGINYGDAGAGADGGIGADNVGGAGADGVVIIRVPTTQAVNLVGLTFTQQTVVSDTVYTITSGTGTLEFVGAGAPSWQQISSPTLQDAFDNGSQITTDTNSLSLQSTAVNPGFPLLSTIDNALNITTEIRANGEIFCSSLLTPGQILQTGTTDTFNMTSVNTTQRDAIITPAVGSLVFNNQTENVELRTLVGWNRCVNQLEQAVVNTLIPIKAISLSPDWDDRAVAFKIIDGILVGFGVQTIFPATVYDALGDYTGSTQTITNNGTRDGAYIQLSFNTPQNNISAFRYYARSDTNERDPIEYYWAVSVSPEGPWLEIASNNIDNWGPPASPRFVENTVPAISGISYCCVRLIVVRMRNSGNRILEAVELEVYRQGNPYDELDFQGDTFMNALSVNTIRPNAVSAGGTIINTDIVPIMTGPSLPTPYVATTDVTVVSFEAWRAFDGDNNSYWSSQTDQYSGIYLGSTTTILSNISSSVKGAYVQIDLGEVKDVKAYTLYCPPGGTILNLPQTWIVSSSLDGITWNYIDFKEFNSWVDNITETFLIANPIPGRYYRISINVVTNGDPPNLSGARIYNWELLEATAEFKPEVSIEGNLLITGGTLLNTLDMTQTSITPENPSSGSNKLYFKNDNELYKLDSAGNEEILATGSGVTLQSAFDNGSQITTDTNSLSLQSTAVNPGFPLLSIIDNALNITTEIRANGDIFSTGSYINPSLTGVINLTGNVNANNNNITNINEITTNIINPAVGFGNINFNGTLLLNGFGITGAGAVSLNSLSGTNPAGVIVNDNLVMTNRNITGLTSLQTTSLNGNGADILVGNAIDMQFRDILDCNLMRINQFSGLNAGADPIDIVSDINVGNNSLIDVLDLNANQITVNTLLGVGVNPIIVNSPVNMNGSNIDNINQATITNDLIVGGITQDTNPTAYVTRYGNVGVPIVTILDGQIDVDPGPIANNGEFLMTSIVGTNTGTRVDVAGYYKVKVSSVIDLPSKATTLTLRIQKRNSDLDPWVTVAQNVVLPDTVSLHEFSQNFFDANISNVGTGFRCTYSAAGGDYTITSLNFEIERKLRTS
jgi:hypothetical protein